MVNLGQLGGVVAQHRKELAIAGAVGVTGLALMKRKRSAAPAAGVAASPSPTGQAKYGGSVGGVAYDSSSADSYNAIQSEVESLQSMFTQQKANPATTAPALPIAATLFAPTYNGNYAQTPDGQGFEVESDGSLFHLNNVAAQKVAGTPKSFLTQLLPWYSTTTNLDAVSKHQTPQAYVYNKDGMYSPWNPPAPPTPTAAPPAPSG